MICAKWHASLESSFGGALICGLKGTNRILGCLNILFGIFFHLLFVWESFQYSIMNWFGYPGD